MFGNAAAASSYAPEPSMSSSTTTDLSDWTLEGVSEKALDLVFVRIVDALLSDRDAY
jgi:hypothetical protein